MHEILTTLYLANSAIAFISYMPQCVILWRMLRSGNTNKSVSLAMWIMWSWANSVTALYAFLVNDDVAFRVISFVNVVWSLITLILTAMVHHRTNRILEKQIHEK